MFLVAHVLFHAIDRWRRHNVEEADHLPCFLPDLYAQEVT